jgi:hypothetical protein
MARRMARTGLLTRTVAVGCVLALATGGCSGSKKATASTPTPPTGESSIAAGQSTTTVPGSKGLRSSVGFRKKVKYNDQVTVSIAAIKSAKVKDIGPGSIKGQVITIFTVRFDNASAQPLNLDQVKVIAVYGPSHKAASKTYYGNLNDFYGTVAAGQTRSASYAFTVPAAGYKSVTLRVQLDPKHPVTSFVGSLH